MSKKVKLVRESELFSVVELADGVYAAIEKDRKTGSNAGIIDTGGFSILFDSFLNRDAAEEFIEISKQLGCSDIKYVVNSHFHTDHVVGNYLLKDKSVMISSNPAREEIAKMQKEFQGEKAQYATWIEKINEQLADEKDEVKIADFNNQLRFLTNLVKPGIDICPADISFEKEMMIHGSKRSVSLINMGMAHSTGDVIALLHEDKVCFMGDLLFAKSHPWLGNGDPEMFIEVLEQILKYDMDHYVPGHGTMGTREDVVLEKQYIKELLDLVKANPERELTLDDLSPDYKDWWSLCFTWNVNFLKNRKKNE